MALASLRIFTVSCPDAESRRPADRYPHGRLGTANVRAARRLKASPPRTLPLCDAAREVNCPSLALPGRLPRFLTTLHRHVDRPSGARVRSPPGPPRHI